MLVDDAVSAEREHGHAVAQELESPVGVGVGQADGAASDDADGWRASPAHPRYPHWVAHEAAKFTLAGRGVWRVLQTQPHARVHVVLALGVGVLGMALGLPAAQLALLLGAIGLVLVAEVVNTAIEAAVDLASPHWHPLARDAKDMAAGAVLLAAIIAALTGLLLLGPPLLAHVVLLR